MTSAALTEALAAALPQERQQSLGEEVASSISHGVALLAAVAAAPFLVMGALQRGDAADIVGASVFAATMALLSCTAMLFTMPCPQQWHRGPRAPRRCSRS